MEDLYTWNKDSGRWIDFLCSWISRINIVKMAALVKATESIQSHQKINPIIQMEAQKTLNSQSTPGHKEQCWRYHTT
jgi:hypothetical protein